MGATRNWMSPVLWSITFSELVIFLGFYAFMALVYIATLWLVTSGRDLQLISVIINYFYKALFTAPLWWLYFKRLKHWSLPKKAFLHLITCPVYVGAWLWIFYTTLDAFNIGRLRNNGIWWDVYIPILVYFMQFGFFHAYEFWLKAKKHQQKERELLELTHTAEINALKAQLQPHFLFNTLNSISATLSPEQEHTRVLLAKLADILRYAIHTSKKDKIPLCEEIQFIRNTLELEQERFQDRLSVSFKIDERVRNVLIPPMLLQPLVENAIKHGIGKSIQGGTVLIEAKKEGDFIHFEIADTGAGLNGANLNTVFAKGIGLSNTQIRLQRLYNQALKIEHNEPKGTIVHFSIPILSHQTI